MKLIIDIPYGLKDVYEHGNVTALDVEEMKRALQNGTPIPDNATNGEIIMAMFPNLKITEMDDSVSVMGEHWEFNNFYSLDWWNAPYQKGGK